MKTNQKKQFHYMACMELTFLDSEKQTGITRVNVMLLSETKDINVKNLSRAQQAAQIQLRKSLNDESIECINAVFINITLLGHMTSDEFSSTETEKVAV